MADQAGRRATFLDRVDFRSQPVLLGLGNERSHQRGDTLIWEGHRSTEVLLLTKGWLDIVKVSIEGRELVIAQRGPGDLIGELSAIDSLPRTASVRATTDVSVTVIPSHVFMAHVSNDPELALALLAHLTARVRQASGGLLELGAVDGASRVCKHLADLLERQATERSPTEAVPVQLEIGSQERFGMVVGLHRSTLVKILGELRQAGIIQTGRGTVTILDRTQLEGLAALPTTH